MLANVFTLSKVDNDFYFVVFQQNLYRQSLIELNLTSRIYFCLQTEANIFGYNRISAVGNGV